MNIPLIIKFYLFIIISAFSLVSCNHTSQKETVASNFVDSNASKSVKKLHQRLVDISKKGIAVGHQDDTSYGLGWNYKSEQYDRG